MLAKSISRRVLATVVGLAAVLCGSSAMASIYYWTGDGAVANWNSTAGGTNWSTNSSSVSDPGNSPGSGDSVYFVFSPEQNASATILGQDFSIIGLTFNAAASTPVGIGGANTLTVGTGGITALAGGASQTISANVNVGATQTWTDNASTSAETIGGTFHAGDVVSTTVDGVVVTYTVLAGDTNLSGVAIGVANAINANASLAGLVNATVNGSIVNVAGYQGVPTLTSSVSGAGATVTATSVGGAALTVSGGISGSAAITLQGNGSTQTPSGAFIFSGSSSYSGAITLLNANASLTIGGSGAFPNAAAVNLGGGTVFTIDNTGTNVANRLSGSLPVNSNGGQIRLLGSAAGASTDRIGALGLNTGTTIVSVTPGSGQSATLTVASINRTPGSSVNFSSNGTIALTTNTLSNGILGPWATIGALDNSGALDFATVSGGNVAAYSNYDTTAAHITTAGTTYAASNMKLSSGTNILAGSVTINTLYMSGTAGVEINAAGANSNTLTIGAGGIIANGGTATYSLGNGNAMVTNATWIGGPWFSGGITTQTNNENQAGKIAVGAGVPDLVVTVPGTYNPVTGLINGALQLNVKDITDTTTALGTRTAVTTNNSTTVTLTSGSTTGLYPGAQVTGLAGTGISGTTQYIVNIVDSTHFTIGNAPTASAGSATATFVGHTGLTKNGGGLLDIGDGNANNKTVAYSFQGPVTVNGGVLLVGNDTNFGIAPSTFNPAAVVLNGGEIRTTATMNMNANRGITVGPQGGTITYTGGSTLNLTGKITGPGGMTFDSDSYNSNIFYNISNTAQDTYQGPTIIEVKNGTESMSITTVNALPSGTALTLALPPNYQSGTNGNVNAVTGFGTLNLSANALTIGSLASPAGVTGANLTGTVNTVLTIGGAAASPVTQSATFNGILANSAGSLGVVKNGGGIQTFTGANTYSGGTTINAGAINVANTTGSGTGAGQVVVNSTGILGGAGMITGPVTVNNGGILQPTVSGQSASTLQLKGGLTLNTGSVLKFNLGLINSGTNPIASPSSDNVYVTGNLAISAGTDTINLTSLLSGGTLAVGTYHLITATGTVPASFAGIQFNVAGPLQDLYTVTDNTGNKSLDLIVTVNPNPFLKWVGAPGNGTWDLSSTNKPWTLSPGASAYADGANLTFDSTPGQDSIITVGTNVAPGSITFNNNALVNYTFNGSTITCANPVTQQNIGSVTFNNANNFGAVTLSGGTIVVGAAGSLTTPSVNVSPGATLSVAGTLGASTALVDNGTITFTSASQAVAALSGTNSAAVLTLNPTALTITAANGTYPGVLSGGGLYLQGGNLSLINTGNNYSGGTSIGAGALLNVAADGSLGASAASPNITFTGGAATLQLGSQFDLNAARNIAVAAGTGVIDTNGFNMAIAGSVSGNGGLDKRSGGTLTLANSANSYLGGTTIDAGTVVISSSGNISSGAVNFNGGTLDVVSGAAPFAAANSVLLNNAASVLQVDAAVATFSGPFTGAGGLFKSGAGSLILTASNGFTGNVGINAGTVALGNSAALGAPANSVTFNAAATTLDLAGFSLTINGGLISGGTQPTGYGLVTNSGTNAVTLTVQDNSSEYSGAIQDSGTNSIGLVVQPNAGKYFILSGSSNYSGGTTVATGGELELWSVHALGAGGALVQNGSSLVLKGRSDPIVYATAPLTFQGNSTLSLNTDATLRNATWGGNVTLDVSTANTTLTVGPAGNTPQTSTLTILGNIAPAGSNGIAGLVKNGASLELILSGSDSYTGGTTVNGGAIRLASAAALPGGIAGDGNGLSNLVFNGGIVNLGFANFSRALGTSADNVQFAGNGGFAAIGAPRSVNLGGAGATLAWGSTPSFLGSGATLLLGYGTDTNTVDFQNPINLGSQLQNVQVTRGAAVVDGQLSGLLNDNGGGGLNVTGNGVLAIVNSANSYTGGTMITGATVSVPYLPNGAGNSPLGYWNNGTGSVMLAGATLRYTGPAVNTDRQFTISVGGAGLDASGAGAVNFTNTAPLTFNDAGAHTLTLTGSNAGLNTLAAVINDGSTSTSISKTGAGFWTLTGSGNYSGPTTVSGGTLALANSALANNSTAVVNGGQLLVGGGSVSIAGLSGSGGSVVVPSGQTLTVGGNNASTAYSGQLGGSGVFNKVGGGALTVTVAGTGSGYSGALNVSGGSLAVQPSVIAASGAQGLNVAAGATFALVGGFNQGLFGQYYNSTGNNADINGVTLSAYNSTLGTLTMFTSASTTVGQNKAANVFNYDSRTPANGNTSGTANTWPAAVVTKATNFDAIWTGYLTLATTGNYTIGFTGNDDAAAMWLDGAAAELVNSQGATGNTTTVTYNCTTPGPHLITVGLVQGGGDYYIYPTITAPGGNAQPIPNSMLCYGIGTVNVGPLSGGGIVNLGLNSLSVNSTSNSSFSGVISGNGGLTKTGPSTLTLNGSAASTYAGATTVNSGALVLDFGGMTSGYANLVNGTSGLVLGGGAVGTSSLVVNGNPAAVASSQSFPATTLLRGGSTLVVNDAGGSGTSVNLGAITRTVPGGTLDLQLSSTGSVVTSAANTNGIIGGYMTVGGATWAVSNGASPITGLSNYAVDEYLVPGTTNNVDVQAGGTPDGLTANSLRFNTPTAGPLTLPGVFVVSSGGVLVTSSVLANPMTISGGTLTAANNGAGNDLIVIQNNPLAALTIGSAITNNGATAIALTKAGPGMLILTGNNTFSGPTTVSGGTLQGSAAILPTSIMVAGGANVTFNETGSTPVTWTNSLTGPGSFTKAGNGTLTISGSNFAYTGATAINGGILVLGSTATLPTSAITVGPNGTFNPQGVRSLGLAPLSVSGTLDLVTGGAASLTTSGAVSLNAATLNFALSGGTALTGGAITVNGANTVNVSGSYLAGTTYTLIAGSSLTMNGGSFVLGSTQLGFASLTPVLTPTAYEVQVIGSLTPLTPYWSGAVNTTTWNDATRAPTSNWCTDATGTTDAEQIPGAVSNVHFSGLNNSAGVTTTLGADTIITSLNIDSGAGNPTISGSNTLTTGTGGVNVALGSGGATLSTNLALGAPQTWTNNEASPALLAVSGNVANGGNTLTLAGSGNTTISGAITAGSGGLIVNSAGGTATLSNTNSYSGGTSVSAGTLIISTDLNLGAVPLAVQAANIYLNGGVLQFNAGTPSNGALTIATNRGITLGPAGATINVNFLNTNQNNGQETAVCYAGVIAGSGGLTVTGSAGAGQANQSVVGLKGNSTYTGGTTVNNAVLEVYNNGGPYNNVLPVTTVLDLVNNGMFNIDASTSVQTIAGLAGDSTGMVGTTNQGTNVGLTISSTGNYEFDGVIGALTVASKTGNNVRVSLVKTGSGTETLTGNNTFSGGLSVLQGTLAVPTANNAAANGPLGAVASVTLGSTNGTSGTLEYTGSGASASNMPFVLATGSTGGFQIDSPTGNLTLSGLISGSASVAKTGSGALTLGGPNTYSGGTSINAGKLIASAFNSLGTGAATIANAATLTLNSGVGPTTYANNVILPAAASANVNVTPGGTPTSAQMGTLSMGSGATLNVMADGGSSGVAYTLNLGNVSLPATANFNVVDSVGTLALGALNDGGVTPATINVNNAGSGALSLGMDAASLVNGTQFNVNGGTLAANSGLALGNVAKVNVAAPATLSFGANHTLGALSGAGSVLLGGYTLTVGNPVNNLSSTFSGVIADGAIAGGGLVKDGAGTLRLTGIHTYTGPTNIVAGRLELGPTAGLGDTAISIGAGATFAPQPATGATITAGAGAATLSIWGGVFDMSGDNAAGTFQVNGPSGSALLLGGGTLCFDVGSSADQLLVMNGPAQVLGPSAISITGIAGIKAGTYPLIVDAAGGLSDGGANDGFASTPINSTVTVGGKTYGLTLSGNDTEEDVTVAAANNSLLTLSTAALTLNKHKGDTSTTNVSVSNTGTDDGHFTATATGSTLNFSPTGSTLVNANTGSQSLSLGWGDTTNPGSRSTTLSISNDDGGALGVSSLALTGVVYSGLATWGGGSGTWSPIANWSEASYGGVPGVDGPTLSATDTATFNTLGAQTVTLDISPQVSALNLSNGPYTLNTTGAYTLRLSNTATGQASIVSSGTQTITAPVALDSPTTVTTPTRNSDVLTLAGLVSGSSGLTKNGSGMLVLSNTNNHASGFTGGTTLSGGTLEYTSSAAVDKGNVEFAGGNLVLNFGAGGGSVVTGADSGSGLSASSPSAGLGSAAVVPSSGAGAALTVAGVPEPGTLGLLAAGLLAGLIAWLRRRKA
ncbi:MAG: autotransporter-associated beta strand repeat-containing protein [Thermoguttaceae bacterium]